MGSEPLYTLGPAELVVIDEDALGLATDVDVLLGVMEELAPTDPRRHEILRALERCLDTYDFDGDAAAGPGGAEGGDGGTGGPHRSPHLGRRPCPYRLGVAVAGGGRPFASVPARFANVAALGERYPELVFACFTGPAVVVDEGKVPGRF